MPFAPFSERFPDIAARETRSATTAERIHGLPPDEYGFLELYCDEPGCDCRRVMFFVVSRGRRQPEAVIAWGWESRDFYARWMHTDDPEMIRELQGPVLNLGSPQSSHAPALLDLFKNVLLRDPEYVERIKRHYRMFRETIESTSDPRVRRKQREKRRKRRRR